MTSFLFTCPMELQAAYVLVAAPFIRKVSRREKPGRI